MKEFLFAFVFEKMTVTINITRWLKEKECNFFYDDVHVLYADIFGTNEFFRIEAEYVTGNVWEVFFYRDKKKDYPFPSRRFSTKEKVHPIQNLYNTVKVTFENGDHITTDICGDKATVENHYLNHLFNLGTDKDNLQKAVKVEFLNTTWEGKPVKNNKPRFIKFTDVFPGTMGEKLDQYFDEQGWKLEYRPAIVGYQVFFGKGVQVDNNYEYGFPYSYSKEELSVFARHLYRWLG